MKNKIIGQHVMANRFRCIQDNLIFKKIKGGYGVIQIENGINVINEIGKFKGFDEAEKAFLEAREEDIKDFFEAAEDDDWRAHREYQERDLYEPEYEKGYKYNSICILW